MQEIPLILITFPVDFTRSGEWNQICVLWVVAKLEVGLPADGQILIVRGGTTIEQPPICYNPQYLSILLQPEV